MNEFQLNMALRKERAAYTCKGADVQSHIAFPKTVPVYILQPRQILITSLIKIFGNLRDKSIVSNL